MTIANRDQAEHRNNSDEVGHWITHQTRYDAMLAPFTDIILDSAALTSGENVLDIGCGCGATTLAAARAVSPAETVGVDLSGPMLDRARSDADSAGAHQRAVRADRRPSPSLRRRRLRGCHLTIRSHVLCRPGRGVSPMSAAPPGPVSGSRSSAGSH